MSIKTLFQNIADAIKAKDSSVISLTPAQMPNAIANLPSGTASPIDIYTQASSGTYAGGLEYSGCIYNNTFAINVLEVVQLAKITTTTSNITLSDSLSNYKYILLQGVYRGDGSSNYNTTILYENIELNTPYWSGMKDRNTSYDTYTTFTSDTTATLGSYRQVIIYGMN